MCCSASAGRLACSPTGVSANLVYRNHRVFGEWVWTTTHGGYTLALANNEIYYRDVLLGPPGRVWSGQDQWLWWDSITTATGMTGSADGAFMRGADFQ